MESSKKAALVQFIKFAVVGVFNTLTNLAVYMIMTALGFHYQAANAAGFVISVLHAFFWQTRFVFKEEEGGEKRVWWQVLLKTYAAYAFTGLFLNGVLLTLWIDVIRIERFTQPLTDIAASFGINADNRTLAVDIAPLLNIAVNVPINFLLNKFWAYRQKKSGKEEKR